MTDRLADLKTNLTYANSTLENENFDETQLKQKEFFSIASDILNELKSFNIEMSHVDNYEISKNKLLKIKQKLALLEKYKFSDKYESQSTNVLNLIRAKIKEKLLMLNNLKTIESNKLKANAIKKILIVSPDISQKDLEIAYKQPDEYLRKKILLGEDNLIINELKKTQTVHNEIVKLESQVKELSEMFMDFSIIVIEQGDHLDNISSNLLYTIDEIDEGNENLEDSINLRKKLIKKQCCLFAILIIIIGIIIGIIFAVTQK